MSLTGCDLLGSLVTTEQPSQGIFGTVMCSPGVCLELPDQPGECANPPYPCAATFDIREYSARDDLGRSNPLVWRFTSDTDGTFRVPLQPGVYCVWGIDGCTFVEVEAGQWVAVALGVAFP